MNKRGYNKEGISTIVATILIILITVAAVTIVWTIILPMVKEDISIEEKMVDLSIETESGYTIWDNSTNNVTVQVSRGSDEENLIGLQFIFTKGGDSESFISYDVPEPNQMKTYIFDLGNFGEPDSISIAGIFENNETGAITSEVNNIPEGNSSGVSGPLSGSVETCYDSDYGLNYTVKGWVNSSVLGWAWEDTCQNGTTLREGYCDSNNNLSITSYVCSNCTDGACYALSPTETCTDSDYGLNYTVKGWVNSSIGGFVMDSCLNNTVLMERYCDSNNNISNQYYGCANCTNGACL